MGFRFQFLSSSRTVVEDQPTSSLQALQRQLRLRPQWPGQLFGQLKASPHTQTQHKHSTLRTKIAPTLFNTPLLCLFTFLHTFQLFQHVMHASPLYCNALEFYNKQLGKISLEISLIWQLEQRIPRGARPRATVHSWEGSLCNPLRIAKPLPVQSVHHPATLFFCSRSPWLGSPATRFPVYTGVGRPACELAGSHLGNLHSRTRCRPGYYSRNLFWGHAADSLTWSAQVCQKRLTPCHSN